MQTLSVVLTLLMSVSAFADSKNITPRKYDMAIWMSDHFDGIFKKTSTSDKTGATRFTATGGNVLSQGNKINLKTASPLELQSFLKPDPQTDDGYVSEKSQYTLTIDTQHGTVTYMGADFLYGLTGSMKSQADGSFTADLSNSARQAFEKDKDSIAVQFNNPDNGTVQSFNSRLACKPKGTEQFDCSFDAKVDFQCMKDFYEDFLN